MKNYLTLFPQVAKQIDKRAGKYDSSIGSRFNVQPGGEGGSIDSRSFTETLTFLTEDLSKIIESRIITGLDVTATTPASDSIQITAGTATSHARLWELENDVTVLIPLDSTTNVFFVTIYNDAIDISKTYDYTRCQICRIIVPKPGTTSLIVDDKPDDGYNGYIISAKDIVFKEDQQFDDASKEKLRDVIGDILANNLIGNIRLSENLKIINTQGSLELDSSSIKIKDIDLNVLAKFDRNGTFFYNSSGTIIAQFAVDEARVGNIRILTNAIQSGNYIENSSGFRIRDDGNAEFNDIKLRGTLYSSTIAENITIAPGVTFIGNLIFNNNVSVIADNKLLLDGIDGDTYWLYNSSTNYLEGWVDGTKRIEL